MTGGLPMNESEAREIFSTVAAIAGVLGGDIRQMCLARGVPEDLVRRFIKEKDRWDRGLRKFRWDGSFRTEGDRGEHGPA
jgi:hypothetical protein